MTPTLAFVGAHAFSQALTAFSIGFVVVAALGVVTAHPALARVNRLTLPTVWPVTVWPVTVWPVTVWPVVAVVVTAGVLRHPSPTGTGALDVLYTVVSGAVIAGVVATARRRTLLIVGLPAAVFLVAGSSWSLWGAVACFAPFGAAVGLNGLSRPTEGVRLATAAALGAGLFHYPTGVPSLVPSVLAAVVVGALLVDNRLGTRKRRPQADTTTRMRGTRRAVLWIGSGATVAALAGVAFVSLQQVRDTRAHLEQSIAVVSEALVPVESLDLQAAKQSLAAAGTELRSAVQKLDTPLWRFARIVPVAAQNATAVRSLVTEAATVVDDAQTVLRFDPTNRLRRPDGTIDVRALQDVVPSLKALDRSLNSLRTALVAGRGPWIVSPVQEKVSTFAPKVERALSQVDTALRACDHVPDLLGAAAARRYLLIFPTPSEARGSGGLIGNWGELRIDNGVISLTRFDRIVSLIEGGTPWMDRRDTFPDGYLERYAPFTPKRYFQNLLASPDFPTNASAMAGQYTEATGEPPVDGVISVDPYGLAAILALEGPLPVDGLPEPVTSENAARTLLFDLYVRANDVQNERIGFLEKIARGTFERIRDIPLDDPERVVQTLGPVFRERHIQIWSRNSRSQAYLDSIRATGSFLPAPPAGGPAIVDSFGVVSQNASGNKIDWFMHRVIDYDVSIDAAGAISAKATIDLQNRAPADGLPDYVIGNVVENRTVARGTATQLISVYSRLDLESASVFGQPVSLRHARELGLNAYTVMVDIPAMSHQELVVKLRGRVASAATGPYGVELLYHPQVNDDLVRVRMNAGSATPPTVLSNDTTVTFR